MSGPRVVLYVSGHGFGHASRAGLVADELLRAAPGAALAVRTRAPKRFFPPAAEVSEGAPDVGMIQRGPLDVDLPASLRAHEEALARWDGDAVVESSFLRDFRADLVVGDVPALACAAADRAGVPSVLVSNFGWDWVMDPYAAADRRWRPIVERYREAYGRSLFAIKLGGGGGFSSVLRVEEGGLIARRSEMTRLEARAALGVPMDGLRLALVSFGGLATGAEPGPAGRFPGWRFMGFGAAPARLEAPWTRLAEPARGPHVDALSAADVVAGKPGYGTFAEAAAHGARVLFVPRPDYRESAALAEWLPSIAACAPLPRARFEAGDWLPALEGLIEKPAPPLPAADGAERIARRLLSVAEA